MTTVPLKAATLTLIFSKISAAMPNERRHFRTEVNLSTSTEEFQK